MTLPIYVYQNGEVTWDVINTITLFFNNHSYASLIWMATVFGFFMTSLRFFMTRDPSHIKIWVLTFIFVPLFAVTVKQDVIVINKGNPGWTRGTIQNVPMILAYPMHLSSYYSYGLTTLFESIFHTVDSKRYSKTGMLYGSRVYRLTRNAHINNATLESMWSHYLRNCIRKDITINHKYAWQDIANTNDIFTFLDNHSPSPVRRITDNRGMTTRFPTCKAILPELKKMFAQEATQSLGIIGTHLGFLGGRKAKQMALVSNTISDTSMDFMKVSQSAKHTLMQSMAVNGMRTGLRDNAARVNATAAQLNYSYTQADLQNKSMWFSMGLQAETFIPLLHTLLFLLIGSSSIFVMALAMIPSMTYTILTNYFKGFVYLATWPPLFVIINFIMTKTLEIESIDIAKLSQGLTFDNTDALYSMHIKFASMAGWLLMSIPMIAPFLVRGGASIMGNVSHQLGGMINSVASRTSAENASGNYNLGNTSLDNHHANKTDTRSMQQTHGSLSQNSDGSTLTRYASGAVYDSSGSVSKPSFNINSTEAQTRSLSHAASDAHRATQTARSAFNDSVADTARDLNQLSASSSHNQSYGGGSQSGLSSSVQEALSTVDSVASDYAQSHNVSKDAAMRELVSSYSGRDGILTGKLGGSVGGEIPKIAQWFTGVKGEGHASIDIIGNRSSGTRSNADHSTGTSHSNSSSDRTSQGHQQQFNAALNTLEQASLNSNTSELHSGSDQSLSSISRDVSQTRNAAQSLDAAYSKEQSYSEAYQKVQSGSVSLGENLVPQFQSWLENNPNAKDNVAALMTGNSDRITFEREAYFEQFLADKVTGTDAALWGAENTTPLQNVTADSITSQGEKQSEQVNNTGRDIVNAGRVNHDAGNDYFSPTRYAGQEAAHAEQVYDTSDQVVNEVQHDKERPPVTAPDSPTSVAKASNKGLDKPDLPNLFFDD